MSADALKEAAGGFAVGILGHSLAGEGLAWRGREDESLDPRIKSVVVVTTDNLLRRCPQGANTAWPLSKGKCVIATRVSRPRCDLGRLTIGRRLPTCPTALLII
jgi:hypothetical protein